MHVQTPSTEEEEGGSRVVLGWNGGQDTEDVILTPICSSYDVDTRDVYTHKHTVKTSS